MDWLTPTIGGAAALGSAAIGGASAAVKNKKTLKYTKQLMDYQWQNYGSPSAQLAAYHSAGINPFASNMPQAQQPQMEQPNIDSPGLVGLQSFMSFIPQMTQLIQSAYSTDILKGQSEGQTLANQLAAFDLTQMKPEELHQLQTNIEKTLADTELSKRQRELVTKQILTEVFKANQIDIENQGKVIDNAWRGKQFEEGMPSIEVDLLRHERDLKDFMAKSEDYRQRAAGRRDTEDQAVFDTFKQNRIRYIKEMGKMQNMVLDALSEKNMNKIMNEFGIPESVQGIVRPIFYGILFMMLDKVTQMADNAWFYSSNQRM